MPASMCTSVLAPAWCTVGLLVVVERGGVVVVAAAKAASSTRAPAACAASPGASSPGGDFVAGELSLSDFSEGWLEGNVDL